MNALSGHAGAPPCAWSTDPVAEARAHLASPDASREDLATTVARLLAELDRAEHCPITGLWTRDAWTRRATRAVAGGRSYVVAFMDLDGFKAINDSFGHDAGDALLAAFGGRLSTLCQHSDGTPARLGGDEFVALLPAERWRRVELPALRDVLTAPVEHKGVLLPFGTSIGAAFVPPGADAAAPARLSTALHSADRAMYQDKAARHGGHITDRRGRLVTAIPVE